MNFANLDFFGPFEVVDSDPNGVLTRPAGVIAVSRNGSSAWMCVGGNVWSIVAVVVPSTGGLLKATRFTEITTNVSTSSTVWVDLLTLTFTTDASTTALLIWAGCNANLSASGSVCFQVTVDGTAVRAGSARTSSSSSASAGLNIPAKKAVTGGASHTVKVRWRVPSGITAGINPTIEQNSQLLLDFGMLLVAEVSG